MHRRSPFRGLGYVDVPMGPLSSSRYVLTHPLVVAIALVFAAGILAILVLRLVDEPKLLRCDRRGAAVACVVTCGAERSEAVDPRTAKVIWGSKGKNYVAVGTEWLDARGETVKRARELRDGESMEESIGSKWAQPQFVIGLILAQLWLPLCLVWQHLVIARGATYLARALPGYLGSLCTRCADRRVARLPQWLVRGPDDSVTVRFDAKSLTYRLVYLWDGGRGSVVLTGHGSLDAQELEPFAEGLRRALDETRCL